MFNKRSRYYKLDDIIIRGADGYGRQSKTLRRPPVIEGRFKHRIESSDRLDHLAYKFYRQSLHWWRLCDANPEFLSPRALLGQTPQITLQINMRWQGSTPPWHTLFRHIRNLLGVESVVQGTTAVSDPVVVLVEQTNLFVLPSALQTELDATVLSQSLTSTLDTALQTQLLTIAGAIRASRVSDTVWQVEDVRDNAVYRFRYDPVADEINVIPAESIVDWALTVRYNSNNISQENIIDQIESLGFEALEVGTVERIGKEILIPPRPVL